MFCIIHKTFKWSVGSGGGVGWGPGVEIELHRSIVPARKLGFLLAITFIKLNIQANPFSGNNSLSDDGKNVTRNKNNEKRKKEKRKLQNENEKKKENKIVWAKTDP